MKMKYCLIILLLTSLLLLTAGLWPQIVSARYLGAFTVTGSKPNITVTPDHLVGQVGDTFDFINNTTDPLTITILSVPVGSPITPGTEIQVAQGAHWHHDTRGWAAGTYIFDVDPPAYLILTVSTGYNTYWLIFTSISLMLAGGYLLFRQKRKIASVRVQDKQ